jgi:spermidine/putrescine transport system substrate-binding protein
VIGGPRALSRRRLLRGIGGAALGAFALDACAARGFAPVPIARAVPGRPRSEPIVRFANWPAYLDRAPGNPRIHPTLAEFSTRTGIKVDYSEPINSNEEFFGRIGIALAMGRNTGYDLLVLTDWLVAQLIDLGWAHGLTPRLVPGAARLLPKFRDWPVPDVRQYSLPWQGGFTGIVYNSRVTGRPISGIIDMLTDPNLHGKVSLVTDMRDVIGLTMLELGIDPADFTGAEFRAAARVLGRAVQSGQVAYVTNYYVPPLTRGKLGACVGWAGDVLYAQETNPEIRFTWPAKGGMLWTDNMVIPATAQHPENAQRLMDFYYQPSVAAQLSEYERYLCPVVGTQEAMRKLDPGLASQDYIFPSPELLAKGHSFKVLSSAQSAAYTSAYQSAVGL